MISRDGKIHFLCDECHTKFVAAIEQAGKTGICNNCSSSISVPILEDSKTPKSIVKKPVTSNQTEARTQSARPRKKKKTGIILTCGAMILFFRLFFGVFVIQPIGAIPDGATVIYWRSGLNMPFIASADGLLDQSGAGVSLLGRGLLLARLAEPLKTRKVVRFSYSRTLYLWSTGGKEYKK